jgi:predicted ATPase
MRSLAGASVLSLVRKELVRPDESLFPGDDGFRFAHILVRDVAYEGMPKAVRADAHERFAGWLEGKAGAPVAEYEEILAYHLEQAASYGRELRPGNERTEDLAHRAAEGLAVAGRRALMRGDVTAATNLLERALRLLPVRDAARLDVVLDLVESYLDVGRFADAEALLERASSAGEGGDRVRAMLTVLRGRLKLESDPTRSSEKALVDARRAISIFEADDDLRGLSRAWELVSDVHWQRGELRLAREAAERGLVYAERLGTSGPRPSTGPTSQAPSSSAPCRSRKLPR